MFCQKKRNDCEMINKLFESLSSSNNTSSIPKKTFSSFSQFMVEIHSKISESILQMRFDRNNSKQFQNKTEANCKYFQLSLKKLYKTHEIMLQKFNNSSKNEYFIEIFFQDKKNGNRHLMERWTIKSEIESRNKSSSLISEKTIGKISILIRSILCLLCNTPLWKSFTTKNPALNDIMKRAFLDYSLFFNVEKKTDFESSFSNPAKKTINLDASGELSINLELEYMEDFSFLFPANEMKILANKEGKFNKRPRFLSEGLGNNFENNMKSDNSTNDSGANYSGLCRCDSENFLSGSKILDERDELDEETLRQK